MAKKPKRNGRRTPIVGIGASAGGVEALGGFFKGIEGRPGLGFVIVTHLSPDRESRLHEVIARQTAMKVFVAADGAEVEADTVHVLPADAVLGIENGRLQVRKLERLSRERKPIDVFFSALAKDCSERCAGVVLSGGDGDGTLGIKAIKERGGMTLAQVADGHGPAQSSMPDSAISTGMIDFAVPADEMGQHLKEFARGLDLLDGVAGNEEEAEGGKVWTDARAEIYAILRSQVGHDFRGYKTNTFIRRVQRRMQVNQVDTPDAYLAVLKKTPIEVNALFRDLLISVTNFFRDGGAFEALETQVIPKLFEGRGAEDVIRIWAPGCATGEEVFSIGILMCERLARIPGPPKVQIFATDIDARALEVARAARYPEALLDSVSKERRERFFVLDGGSYQLTKEVRDLCMFSPHSVIRDPPFSRMDLVSCRNLLIYFGPEMQKGVIPTFHYSLRPGGYLFLGMSENVSQYTDLFTPLDKKHRIFRRRDDAVTKVRIPSLLPGFMQTGERSQQPDKPRMTGTAVREAIDAQVLEHFAPAHVVVNDEDEVVYYSRRTGKYLEAPQGAPSRSLLSLARKGLRLDLRTALREAAETGQAAVREGVSVETEDRRVQLITLTVEPVADRPDGEALFLVLFADDGSSLSVEEAQGRLTVRADDAALHLERELRDTRERLQGLIEEYETQTEELKSSNEELVSVNEELQSSNEELETSKEEMQSLNEELQTVNADRSHKIDELDSANSDLRNLFESTQVANVFLDRDLVIRTFTPAATTIYNIRPSDQGRPITDLSTRTPMPDFTVDVRKVFESGEAVERRVDGGESGSSFLVRVIPYRNTDGAVVGVLLTFIDVTTLARSESRQRVLISELNHRVKNILAVAISIAASTSADGRSTEAFRTVLTDRLRAMARSYSALSRENWTDVDLRELATEELDGLGDGRIDLKGPEMRLKPKQAVSIGMVLHELATNASKYGALSKSDGRVRLAWRRVDGQLFIDWREQDGPAVVPPDKDGFGLELVRQEMSYNLGGGAEIDFAASGLKVSLRCPI
jgi:two-component system, chemotaxis family, CheB/CheR fusion protein